MSWIRSSKGTALLVTLLIAVAAVGTAAAVSVTANTSKDAVKAGEEVTVTVKLDNLYSENDRWNLSGTTQLENTTGWQVTKVRPAGNTTLDLNDPQVDDGNFEIVVDRADNVTAVVATITGDAPPVESFSYAPPQTFTAGEFTRIVGNSETTIRAVTIHHYTNESREARQAIQDAEEAVNGTNNADAQSELQDAISDFNDGDFQQAIDSANEAEQTATQAKQSQQTMQLVLYAVGAVVLLALIGGGVYYYRNQQDSYDKLR